MRGLLPACLATAMLLISSAAYAQGSIAGIVRDTSGAVLPGVTVEAASPALIEKVRSVTADSSGQYAIENLRPGIYTVTFTLAGFSTVKREGVELQGSFAATVNADMRVGALEETITVTGESPVVDVRTTQRQQVLSAETIAEIPSSRGDRALATLIPGVSFGLANQDVGGTANVGSAIATVHGSRTSDTKLMQNGVAMNILVGGGGNNTQSPNMSILQEIVVDTAAVAADTAQGGLRINWIPKDGGNTFTGTLFVSAASEALQSNNVTDDLRQRGLLTPSAIRRLGEFNPGVGGPLMRDRLWFYAGYKYRLNSTFASNAFVNRNATNPNAWTYDPDPGSRPYNKIWENQGSARLTWQVAPKHKLAFGWQESKQCFCQQVVSATTSPEAASFRRIPIMRIVTGDWTAPLTNRLLVEAVGTKVREWISRNQPDGTPAGMIAVQDQAFDNLRYRTVSVGVGGAAGSELRDFHANNFYYRGTVSYITGAHTFKVGFNSGFGKEDINQNAAPIPWDYRFNNGVPNLITLYAYPFTTMMRVGQDTGIYGQDRWTLGRLTLGYGLRYDHFTTYFPENEVGPTPLLPTRNLQFPRVDGASYHDFSPKSSAAFDVFGNGKTALKVTLNKYLGGIGSGDPVAGNVRSPVGGLVRSTTRSWADSNRNFVPDCDLATPAANGECGALANNRFGTVVPGATVDPDVLKGWGKRAYNWEFSAGVQHEVVQRVSVDVSYFRRWYGNFSVMDNTLVSAADYTTFDLTVPNTDSRLPTSGSVIRGYRDLNPNKVGQVAGFVTSSDNFGKQIEHWNGVDVIIDARPRNGLRISGGTSTGRTSTDNCEIIAIVPEAIPVGSPSAFCDVDGKFVTQLKLLGSYTIPRIDVLVSGTVQNLPGPEMVANFNAPNATVAPLLGRNLSGGAANTTLQLIRPQQEYGDRLTQLDVRFGKWIRIRGLRTNLYVDLYNALNASTILTQNGTFGAAWLRPQSILTARFLKIGAQLDF